MLVTERQVFELLTNVSSAYRHSKSPTAPGKCARRNKIAEAPIPDWVFSVGIVQ
jgi:hypothetical protein